MKLDGRNRIVYECDNAVRKKTAEGSVHTIRNRDGLEAMLLDRALCTKEMEHRVMNAMNGIGEWYGPAVTDILCARISCLKTRVLRDEEKKLLAYAGYPESIGQ